MEEQKIVAILLSKKKQIKNKLKNKNHYTLIINPL